MAHSTRPDRIRPACRADPYYDGGVPTAREVLERDLPEGVAVELVAAVVARIGAAGRAAWPGVAIADELIAARLAARLRDDAELRAAPGGAPAHDADVFLAFALAAGDPAAVRAFEERFVPQIELALRRLRLPAGTIDEIKQVLRFDLLVGDGGAPRIADYAGRGELAGWLRVTATRRALSAARRAGREEALDDLLLAHWPDASPGPAGKHLRAKYTAELKRAIHEAFAALEVRQRNLLRQHVLDELTIDDLARLYRAHRATCARWLADARAELGKGTRKRLIAALGLQLPELESLLRFLDSDIELSISRILHGEPSR
jgi:RNA polymerase sigma-70 factor (ECF subfamily)